MQADVSGISKQSVGNKTNKWQCVCSSAHLVIMFTNVLSQEIFRKNFNFKWLGCFNP